MLRDYELGFILNPEVNEEQTRAILERIEQIVTNYGGQVMRVNQWGRRRLAYQIEHFRDGFYVFIDMTLTPETVSELDRTLKVSEEVIRHLIKRRDPKVVQKEREAQANAPATAAPEAEAPADETTAAIEAPADEIATPAEAVEAPAEEVEEVHANAEDDAPTPVNAEEHDFAPPAIPEETVEA